MDPKDHLRKMIDHTINGDNEAAANEFKQFLIPKTIDILGSGKKEVEVEPTSTTTDME